MCCDNLRLWRTEGNAKSQKKQRCRPLTTLVVVLLVKAHIGDVGGGGSGSVSAVAEKLKMVTSPHSRNTSMKKVKHSSITHARGVCAPSASLVGVCVGSVYTELYRWMLNSQPP